MPYTLDTSHPLYGNLVELIGVKDGALVSHKTARTFTKHADASYVTGGSYGEAFRFVGGGYTPKGATFSPSILVNTISNPNVTVFIVVNRLLDANTQGNRPILGGTYLPSVGYGDATAKALAAYDSNVSTYAVEVSDGAARSFGVTRTGETAHTMFVNGELIGSGGVLGYANAGAEYTSIGGISGQASSSGDLVWVALFDKVLTPEELLGLHNSLGANNTFALVSSGPTTTDATAPGATLTGTATLEPGSASGTTSGSFTSDEMVNNTGSALASTAVIWTWWQGSIGATPTSLTHGTGTTDASGVLTVTGLPVGTGFLIVRTTDSTGVYYQPGTVS